ncbi:error-prone DNA polymerase [Bartonella sp. HY406]|uniref:error-prone DNA polymerase n=1 Tax=Bartonella sp. HY406 TaxID=2979331 RepID=UPI0021C7F818|nr:error-prone DNA polymerase [Bartonella sp. HY406]UXN03519.1 error-prone DNA polymerase [Bartonella sp. HY406]
MVAIFEMVTRSNYSFLQGASHPHELIEEAAKLGYSGIGLADINSLAGIIRGLTAARKIQQENPDFRYLVGCRLQFTDNMPDLIVYPRDRAAYGQLCRLLSEGKMRSQIKGQCHISWADFCFRARFFQIITIAPATIPTIKEIETLKSQLLQIVNAAPRQVWLALDMAYMGSDQRRAAKLLTLSQQVNIPLIATTDILYHRSERRPLQDVLTAICLHTSLDEAGYQLAKNAERHMKPIIELQRIYRNYADSLLAQQDFVTPIHFSLDEISYSYPDEPVPQGKDPQNYLSDLTWQGANERYKNAIPDKITAIIRKELTLIDELNYAPYFLTVYDIVSFAKEQGILCQGRGSAANSAICYCLGITNVNPNEIDLLFERFISKARDEPPDIDVDFEHERREEVMQYIYRRYGLEKAAIVATVISYRARSAIRDVCKVLSLGEDISNAIAGTIWGSHGGEAKGEHIQKAGLDPDNPRIYLALQLVGELIGFPRHLSQHVGGFVLSRERLDEIVPIGPAAMENRTFIEWDKDDIDEIKLMKVDVLSLGMLTMIRKAFLSLKQFYHINHGLYTLPANDEQTYAMLQKGDSIGVFQVESRAQINMLPRLRPQNFYDLVIQVAIVRPGPIQGDMVHPYLRRRNGQEQVSFPSPDPAFGPKDELKQVLNKTLGVPLFQEQAMRIAIDAAGFSPDEANDLRRAMATFRRTGKLSSLGGKMIGGMVKRGYDIGFAQNCFKQIEGFGEYGFPESHAASFAHLVYVSAFLKCHYPDVFACALLNSQPMGFYAPAQIIRDAREHDVIIKPIDINLSFWDNHLEKKDIKQSQQCFFPVRLGFRQINGFSRHWAEIIAKNRQENGDFHSIEEIHHRLALPRRAYNLLADADCFRSLNLDRRESLWATRRLPDDETLPLFKQVNAQDIGMEEKTILPVMELSEQVIADYETTRLSLKAHPVSFLRANLAKRQVIDCVSATQNCNHGTRVKICGIVTVRQRPGSAKGVVFLTIEDESGIANIVVWTKVLAQFRREVMSAKLIEVHGYVERDASSGVVHVVAKKIIDQTSELLNLAQMPERFTDNDNNSALHPRQVRILPKSRDFH